jgi:hypothetical protein
MSNSTNEDDGEDNIVSSADAAVTAAKWDRWTCIVITYLVAIFIGIPVPIAATILFTFVQKNPSWPYPPQSKSIKQNNSQPQKPVSMFDGRRIIGFLALTLLCASLGLALNQWLDFSQVDSQTFTILEKHITHSRKWGDSYYVKIQSPVASPIAALDFGGQEDIKIHEADYNRVVPGQTTITLSIAKGVFHLPWYSSAYSISDK